MSSTPQHSILKHHGLYTQAFIIIIMQKLPLLWKCVLYILLLFTVILSTLPENKITNRLVLIHHHDLLCFFYTSSNNDLLA